MEDDSFIRMNYLGDHQIPFLFVIDFEKKKPWVCPLDEVDGEEVCFDVNGFTNTKRINTRKKKLRFQVAPTNSNAYKVAFDTVLRNIRYGNSFLLNLTQQSSIKTNYTLKDIFRQSKAKYKLWFKNEFVVFSPEIFVKTDANRIMSFPMKGTIDADLPNAKEQLLASEKELAEHYTIVDLIRNDLSMVAKNVKVDRFRYFDHIKTHRNNLLQMSSEISGDLEEGWQKRIGDMMFKMLPAGSISGAPKKKTLKIIQDVENYERGYYTGVFGVFDGKNIDSGVMIRFIEQTNEGFVYKSGGGITAKSNREEEYNELIDKIYIPLK